MHHHIGSASLAVACHQNPSLPTMALLCHGLGASCGVRCLHMLPLITAYRSNSSRETWQVPLKEHLEASLVRHEEPWVCWENMKPCDWLNAAQAPLFLMPSSTTSKAPNTVFVSMSFSVCENWETKEGWIYLFDTTSLLPNAMFGGFERDESRGE